MLEYALGFHWRAVHEFQGNGFSILRPHGSVNWGQLVKSPVNGPAANADPRRYVLDSAAAGLFDATDDYVVLEDASLFQYVHLLGQRGQVLVRPALAVPVDNKDAFATHPTHITAMQDAVQRTRRLLTIGWRGQEAQFTNLWRARNDAFHFMAVSGGLEASEATDAALRGTILKDDASGHDRTCFAGGFSELTTSPQLEQWLNLEWRQDMNQS